MAKTYAWLMEEDQHHIVIANLWPDKYRKAQGDWCLVCVLFEDAAIDLFGGEWHESLTTEPQEFNFTAEKVVEGG